MLENQSTSLTILKALHQNQLDRINVNYCSGMGACYAHSSTGAHIDTNEICVFYDQSHQLEYNVVNIKEVTENPARVIQRWETLLSKLNTPYQVFAAPWLNVVCAPYLESSGYQKTGYMTCMVMPNLQDISVPIFTDIVIKKVNSIEAFNLFQQIIEESYDYELGAGAILPSFMQRSNCEMFLAYIDGQAAATSLLYKTDDIAGIYWVGVKKAYRGRGLGQAVTWASIETGKKQGCSLASLQASDMGEPMYQKMGFSIIIPYTKYVSHRSSL